MNLKQSVPPLTIAIVAVLLVLGVLTFAFVVDGPKPVQSASSTSSPIETATLPTVPRAPVVIFPTASPPVAAPSTRLGVPVFPATNGSTGTRRTGADCYDNSHSDATGSGACSGHGGVRYWLYN